MSTAVAAGPRTGPVLATVLTAAFLTQAGVTAVNVAVPAIQRGFDAGPALAQWILAGYTLPFALLLITGGRLGDLLGRRRVFLAGAAGFAAASLLAALAPGPGVLVAARVLQGASAAVVGPQVLAVMRAVVPDGRRGAALGAYSAVIGLATVGGPVLGGVLVQFAPLDAGWRAIPAAQALLGLAVLAGGTLLPDRRERTGGGLDPLGLLLATACLLLLLHPLLGGAENGWPWHSWAALAAAPAAAALFAAAERRRERRGGLPLVPVALFADRVFTTGLLVTVVTAALVGGFFLVFVLHLQNGAGMSPALTGLVVSPWALGTAAASRPAIAWARRRGRRVLMAGGLLMAAGLAALAALTAALPAPPPLPTMALLALVGVGMGLVSAPVLDLVLAALPEADSGAAAGVFTTFKQVGAALGVAVLGGLYFAALGAAPSREAAAAVTACGAAACLLLWPLLLLMPSRTDDRGGDRR